MTVSVEMFVRSRFLQFVQEGDMAVIWHSLFGYPMIVSADTLEFLSSFVEPATIEDRFGGELAVEDLQAIEELKKCFFLVPDGFDDRVFLEGEMRKREAGIVDGSLIDFLELIMSEACNFRCIYCIHFNNLETSDRINNPSKFMKFKMAKEVVDRYLEVLRRHGKKVAEINFGGGEPMLAWLVIRQVLEYIK